MGRHNDTIPVDQCIDGHLYIISARNASLGICKKARLFLESEVVSFTISRYKFKSNYLFDELHWDCDDHYGTACPLLDLGPVPEFADEKATLDYLNAKYTEYEAKIEELDQKQIAWDTAHARPTRKACLIWWRDGCTDCEQCGSYADTDCDKYIELSKPAMEEFQAQRQENLKRKTASSIGDRCPKCGAPVKVNNSDPKHIQGLELRTLVCSNQQCDWTEKENAKYR